MPLSPRSSFESIDQARGIAILLVILVHVAQKVEGLPAGLRFATEFGQLGVQLFFVASAFTLAHSYERRQGKERSAGPFYVRRFFRIAPLYYVGIVFYSALHLVAQAVGLEDPAAWTLSGVNVLANVFFVHGFVPAANNSVVPGGWSIGTEMAFYALFPWLYVGIRSLHARGAWLMGALVLAAVGLNAGVQMLVCAHPEACPPNNSFWYYHLLNQLPVFLLGLWFYLWFASGSDKGRAKAWPRGGQIARLACSAVVLAGLTVGLWGSSWPVRFALVPASAGLAFVCVVWLLLRTTPRLRWLVRIGQVSYSIYLFHFVFAWYLLPALWSKLGVQAPGVAVLVVTYLSTVVLTYGVALVSQRLIEAPGIALGARLLSAHARRTAGGR